jgi:hypothetical protein
MDIKNNLSVLKIKQHQHCTNSGILLAFFVIFVLMLPMVSIAQDSDSDGIDDTQDNCIEVANPNQRDSNSDGFGNVCDADLDNNNSVSFADLDLFRSAFGTNNSDADFDGNGSVSFADLDIFRALFGKPPGPSGKNTLPIGMNIDEVNYYSGVLPFYDLMMTASEMMTYPHGTGDWDSEQMNNIPVTGNGWPLELPYRVGGVLQDVRFLINNNFAGEYVVLFDGDGTIEFAGESRQVDGAMHINLPGDGENTWFNITSSNIKNPIRNMRIIPVSFKNNEGAMPTFHTDFLHGLRPFHALRFMDFANTNNSTQIEWSDRNTKQHYTQGNSKGVAWEYMIDLANELNADIWICVPHMASDDYISHLARLFLDKLKPGLKLHLEYSNEVWNWIFSQANYVLDNAPGHPDSYVSAELAAIGPAGHEHPEKDAYMMARTFRIFESVWGNQKARIVRVAAVQHGWVDNTRRILEYLFNTDGKGADVVAPAGYFSYSEDDHASWVAMNPTDVTAEMILQSADNKLDNPNIEEEADYTRQTAAYANQFGLDFVVYEGGQHMQPHHQENWDYNHAVYDAQINPKMYELYMKNFAIHQEPVVNCKLFMAYSYVGPRESRWGSWGHLESLQQLSSANLKTTAPKYQALLDINTQKEAN